jgi:hypothetical protein
VRGHLEDAHLTGRAEAIFHRPQHPKPRGALEGQRCVDHVLDDLGTRDLTLFGDVADQHERAPHLFGRLGKECGAVAYLRHGAGRAVVVGEECLHRVDDHEGGAKRAKMFGDARARRSRG